MAGDPPGKKKNAELAGKPSAELAGKPNAELAGKPIAKPVSPSRSFFLSKEKIY